MSRERARSGFGFGLACVGSSLDLMLVLLAVGLMSVTWMCVVAVLVLAQKLLPPEGSHRCAGGLGDRRALGILIVVAPTSVPALSPPM